MIIEVVDTLEKIDRFIPLIDPAIKKGLITVEDVNLRLYRNDR
jgi:PII-like signaling protein